MGSVVSIHAMSQERRRASSLANFEEALRSSTVESSRPVTRMSFSSFLQRLVKVSREAWREESTIGMNQR